jgi:hypothetical protein
LIFHKNVHPTTVSESESVSESEFFFGFVFGSSQNIRIISDSDPQHWLQELAASEGPFAEFLRDHHHTENPDAPEAAKTSSPSDVVNPVPTDRLSRSLDSSIERSLFSYMDNGVGGDLSVCRRWGGSPCQISLPYRRRHQRPPKRPLRSVSECGDDDDCGSLSTKQRFRDEKISGRRSGSPLRTSSSTSPLIPPSAEVAVNHSIPAEAAAVGSRLTEDEEVMTGQVKMKIYLKYIQVGCPLFFRLKRKVAKKLPN